MNINDLILELADYEFGIAICTLIRRYKATSFEGEYFVEECTLRCLDEPGTRAFRQVKQLVTESRMSDECKKTPDGSNIILYSDDVRIIVDEACYLGDGVFAFVQYDARHIGYKNRIVLARRCNITVSD